MQDHGQPQDGQDAVQYGIVLVTVSSRSEGEAIAAALLEAKLAACVTLFPVHSIYTWQGNIQRDEEQQLLIKTDLRQFAAIAAKVTALHSYEVPEVIALPIVNGSQPYLNWLAANVGLVQS